MDRAVAEIRAIAEFYPLAKARLEPKNWDYLTGGAESETTMARNRQALDSLAFRPRVLRDMTDIDLSSACLGLAPALPILLAPIGSMQNFTPDGALPAARAAGAADVPYMVSSVSAPTPEALRAVCDGDLMFQLYVRGDMDWVFAIVDRIVDLGFSAFCITVDSAVYSRRERDKINRYDPRPGHLIADSGAAFQAALTWRMVEKIRARCKIPLILKGIATPEDALLAVDHGIDGVYVSNHGGRQLDHGLGAIDVLPEIVAAVGGRADVIIDGGFCRGSDIIKALALGAASVGLGRLYAAALVAHGQDGVARMLEILEEELRSAMALLGINRLADLSPDCLRPAPAVRRPGLTSAFPALEPAPVPEN
jgi:glycolate oxidase